MPAFDRATVQTPLRPGGRTLGPPRSIGMVALLRLERQLILEAWAAAARRALCARAIMETEG